MTNPKENIEESPALQPAGEAPGSDLPPEGQGGPHLPDISEPTRKSLAEQFEGGPPMPPMPPMPANPPAEEPHKCFVCNGPDHRACGCEAREKQRQIEQDDESFRNQDIIDEEQAEGRMDQELDRDEVLEKTFKASKSGDIDPTIIIQVAAAAGRKFAEDIQTIHTLLGDINCNLETLVKIQKDRVDLLKDIKNAGGN